MNIRIPSIEEAKKHIYTHVPQGTIPPIGSIAYNGSYYLITGSDGEKKYLDCKQIGGDYSGMWGMYSDISRHEWKWYIPKKKIMVILNEED